MPKEVSVDKAIKRGHLTVNLPVLLCLIGIPAISVLLYKQELIEAWGIAIAAIIGFITAWIVWSFMITKWRIWAFEHVRNVHELKKRAIEEKLIWKDGNSFEKTEIRSKSERIKLNEIKRKFLKKDSFQEDPSVPKISKIYYSRKDSNIQLVLSLLLVVMSIYFYLEDVTKFTVLATILMAAALFYLFKAIKKILDNKPQITIDSNGIRIKSEPLKSWYEIFDEQVVQEGFGASSEIFLIYYDEIDTHVKVNIDNFNIKRRALENVLRTHRIRHQKMNPRHVD